MVGAALAAVVFAGSVSAFYRVWYVMGASEVAIFRGKLLVTWGHTNPGVQIGGPGLHWRPVSDPGVVWWVGPTPDVFSKWEMPLWIPAIALIGVGAWAIFGWCWPRGVCRKCGYDVASLPPGAVCPECGAAIRRGPSSRTL